MELADHIANMFEQPSAVSDFLEHVRQAKPRYIRDQLLSIRSVINDIGVECVFRAICYCQENNIYDVSSLKSLAQKYAGEQKQLSPEPGPIKLLTKPENQYKANIQPMTSNIADYENIVSN